MIFDQNFEYKNLVTFKIIEGIIEFIQLKLSTL